MRTPLVDEGDEVVEGEAETIAAWFGRLTCTPMFTKVRSLPLLTRFSGEVRLDTRVDASKSNAVELVVELMVKMSR